MSTFGNALWGGSGSGSSGSTAPTTLVSNLLYHAMRLAGVTLGPQRIPSANQYADALMVFNRMTGWLNVNRLNIATLRIDDWPLTPGQQSYTLGPGGDWDTDRPPKIERARLVMPSNSGGSDLRRKIEILTDQQWAAIALQAIQTSIPLSMYDDGAYPLRNLSFYPVPTTAYQVELYTWQRLSTATAITDELFYSEGYEEAIVSNLAVRLFPVFQLQPRADVIELARTSLAEIQRLNNPMPLMACDGGVLSHNRSGRFNWLTGEIE